MKFAEPRPYADPDKVARKLIEIANAVEPVQGRHHSREMRKGKRDANLSCFARRSRGALLLGRKLQ